MPHTGCGAPDGLLAGMKAVLGAMSLRQLSFWGLAGALAGMVVAAQPAAAAGLKDSYGSVYDTKAWVMFSGFDAVKDANYTFQGVIYALNRDISRDGFVLRVYGSHVDYEYDTPAVTGGVVDGDGWQGDVMIGYKFNRGHWWAAGFIGVDYQDHDLTPDDPANPVRGSEVGLKVAGDIATPRHGAPIYFGLSGQYSTAFDTYWARARAGLNRDRYTVGPEGIVMGSDSFDAQRVGGFLTFDLNLSPRMPIEVTLSGGYQFIDADNGGGFGSGGGEGAYGGIVFVTVF